MNDKFDDTTSLQDDLTRAKRSYRLAFAAGITVTAFTTLLVFMYLSQAINDVTWANLVALGFAILVHVIVFLAVVQLMLRPRRNQVETAERALQKAE